MGCKIPCPTVSWDTEKILSYVVMNKWFMFQVVPMHSHETRANLLD
jgi:hypothetical protein